MNFIQRYQPALSWVSEINRFIDRNISDPVFTAGPREAFYESENSWILRLDLPGYRKENVNVTVTDRVAPGVVYTTFHHPATQANVVTTEFSDWATNCPEYKVTAVQILPSNGPTEWQESYASWSEKSRRIMAEPAE